MNLTRHPMLCTKHPENLRECPWCGQDERLSDGCSENSARNGNGSADRIPHDREVSGRCPTCRALPGRYHHAGCDRERCPSCLESPAIYCLCMRDYRELVPWLLRVVRVFVRDMPDGPVGVRDVRN